MPRILTTQTNYIVISAIDSRSYMHERYTDDLGRRQVIRDIADGQYEALTQVIEFNVANNSCRDVTVEILREAGVDAEPVYHPQYLAWDRGHDQRKNWERV